METFLSGCLAAMIFFTTCLLGLACIGIVIAGYFLFRAIIKDLKGD